MREKLEKRLAALKSEFEAGQKLLADIEAKRANVMDTVVRISGAIQVLEELLEQEPANTGQARARVAAVE